MRETMKTKIITTFLGLLLVFSYSEVRGADWIYIGEISKDSYYYDRESISHSDINIVRTWTKIEYSDLREIVGLVEINCKTKMARILSTSEYNQMGDVEALGSASGKWAYITPETMIDKLHSALCK
jgi:hypothetical protein